MTIEELAALVAEMRHAQTLYFRTRTSSDLDDSKRLEKRVDEACKAILSVQQQKTMFD